jgi:hypothetical protein
MPDKRRPKPATAPTSRIHLLPSDEELLPALPLAHRIHDAADVIAPERGDALAALVRERSINLSLVETPRAFQAIDDRLAELAEVLGGPPHDVLADIFTPPERDELDRFLLYVDTATGDIRFGWAVIERLWAYTVAYLNLIQVAERFERDWTVGAEQRTQVQHSLHILAWALRNEFTGKQTAWPPNLYPPREDYPPGSLAHRAVVLFQVMVGWMLLHELGHVVHRHPGGFQPPAVSKKQELDADDWAFEWVFGARRFGRTARDRAEPAPS